MRKNNSQSRITHNYQIKEKIGKEKIQEACTNNKHKKEEPTWYFCIITTKKNFHIRIFTSEKIKSEG